MLADYLKERKISVERFHLATVNHDPEGRGISIRTLYRIVAGRTVLMLRHAALIAIASHGHVKLADLVSEDLRKLTRRVEWR